MEGFDSVRSDAVTRVNRKQSDTPSPARVVRILAISVFALESALMVAFSLLPPMLHGWVENVLDGTLLTLLLSPILYLFLFRPMQRNIAALNEARKQLQKQRGELAQEVALRTDELVRANSALEASFREIDDLYRHAPCGYHSLDEDGLIVRMNDTELSWLGYAREEIIGKKHMAELIAPQSRLEFAAHFSLLGTTGALNEVEIELMRKDGSVFPALVNVSAVLDARGQFVMSRATVFDITRRKKAEKEREQYFKFFNTATDLLAIADLNGGFTKINPAFAETLGYSEAEILKKPFTEFVHPADRQRTLVQIKGSANPGGTLKFENRYICKDGSVRWLSWSAIVDDEEQLIYAAARDTTRQKQYEQSLFNSNQVLQRIFNTTHFSVVYLDRNFNFIRVNQAYADVCGHPADYFPGKNHFQLYPNAENEAIFRNVVETGKEYTAAAKPFTFPDHPEWGVTYWDWTLHPLKSPDGHVDALLFVLLNVTERRRSEEARSRFAEELEIQVTQRTAELAHAKKEAENANSAKSRFLAAASHDLRQPLSALRLYTGVLRRKVAPADQGLLVDIDECVASLSDLLSKLLDLSKLEAGVITPRVRDFAPGEMFNKLHAAYAPAAEAKGLDLRCRVNCSTARTDPVLFQRIVGNLVDNAIHYTHLGGVLITCRRRDGKRWVEVWDTGVGIPENKIGEAFEEFRQLGDDARTQGSGLGLTIVARTARLLGLEIRVHSHPGRGSMFAVELPEGSTPRPDVHPKTGGQVKRVRIGAVDDNPASLKALVRALESAGHDVVGAASGAELLTRLGERAPDLVISDYRLAAGETGFDVITAARAAYGRTLPALIITGDTDPNLMRNMAEQGIIILHKPLEFDELHAHIEETLRPDGAA